MQRQEAHIPFLDHIRGVAILMVFAYHCLGVSYGFDHLKWSGWFPDFHVPLSFLLLLPVSFGWAGVSVFFVISGFCIHLSHQRSRFKDWATFFTRRFFRIYPPYFLALAFFVWRDNHSGAHLDDSGQIASHFLLVHNLREAWFFGVNPSFWSIAVEVQLYLIYPVLLFLTTRFTWAQAIGMLGVLEVGLRGLAGTCDTIYHEPLARLVTGSPFFYWFSWSIGAWTAEAFLKGNPLPFRGVPVWLFPLLAVLSAGVRPLEPFCFLFVAMATVCVIDFLLDLPDRSPRGVVALAGRHLGFAGIVSYSGYLIHQRLVLGVGHFLLGTHLGLHFGPPLVFVLCLAVWLPMLLLAWVYYRLIELPSIDLGKRLVQKFLVRPPVVRGEVSGAPVKSRQDGVT